MRIYVACLASYNNGVLHGKWIDATDDKEEMQREINEILRASRFPNVTRQIFEDEDGAQQYVTLYPGSTPPEGCTPIGEPFPSAEEWAIHDHEGLGDLGEYAGLDEVARRVQIAEVAEDHDIPIAVLIEAMEDEKATDPKDFVSDKYRGKADSWADFAQEFTEETNDMSELPKWVQGHIDWESIGRDFELGGDWSAYDHEGEKYFFDN